MSITYIGVAGESIGNGDLIYLDKNGYWMKFDPAPRKEEQHMATKKKASVKKSTKKPYSKKQK